MTKILPIDTVIMLHNKLAWMLHEFFYNGYLSKIFSEKLEIRLFFQKSQ